MTNKMRELLRRHNALLDGAKVWVGNSEALKIYLDKADDVWREYLAEIEWYDALPFWKKVFVR